jgi:hypothetical protein
MLRGVIFSLRNVLAKRGEVDTALLGETLRLLKFLKQRGVTPVFASNHDWTVTNRGTGKSQRFQEALEEHLGPLRFYLGGRDGMPYKPKAAALEHILEEQGWTRREVVYVGNSDDDMKTAVNGRVLFVNAIWHGEANRYGYQFESPKDVARFVDCICLGLDNWFWALEDGPIRVYALAPFTTLSPTLTEAHTYSANARATAKEGTGNATFWGRLLSARVYFSGLVDEIDYIAAYPGHAPNSKHTVVAEALTILAQSIRKRYLPDLIIRHRKAQKSQSARTSGGTVDIQNQLRTIRLNKFPRKGPNHEPFKNNPLGRGKTALLVDDICTQGHSFETGRAFIEKTGAKVICLGWLKTINSDYHAVADKVPLTDPYVPYTGTPKISVVQYPYRSAIVDPSATIEVAEKLERYLHWDWPVRL